MDNDTRGLGYDILMAGDLFCGSLRGYLCGLRLFSATSLLGFRKKIEEGK